MAIPIAITGSYFFNDIELTASYARITHMEQPIGRIINTSSYTDFLGTYEVDVYYSSESFASATNGDMSVSIVEGHMFNYTYKFDEGDPDPVNQVYDNLIASQSAFSNMTKKIYS